MTLLREFESAVLDIITASTSQDLTSNTDAGYDLATKRGVAPPAAPSLTPGSWLSETCVHGRSFTGLCMSPEARGWKHQGEVTDAAEAIRDAYQFRQGRATVVREVDVLPEQQPWFLTNESSGGGAAATPRNYCSVSQYKLNESHSKYLSGEISDYDLLLIVENYVTRKARQEARAFDARSMDLEEDLVSDFKIRIFASINEKRCRGDFASYINRAWRNHAASFFCTLTNEKRLFQQAFNAEDDSSDDGNHKDAFEQSQFQTWAAAERSKPSAPGSGLSKLEGKKLMVAQMLIAGQKQGAIAEGLGLSRHQVARIEKQIAKRLKEQA